MKLQINTELELDASEVYKAMSPEDFAEIISDMAEAMSKDVSYSATRARARKVEENLSELGRRLFIEVAAAALMRAKEKE